MQIPTKKVNPHDRLPYRGLTSQQVEHNRQQYGANILQPPEREPAWKLFLAKFDDPVIQILAIAAILAIAVGVVEGDYIEGIGIIVAILIATTLAFINEYQAEKEFDVLNQVYDTIRVKVIRDCAGRTSEADRNFTTVPRQDLVVGDIIYLEQGEEVPADGVVLEEVAFYIDQSKITGESEAVKKCCQAEAQDEVIDCQTYPADKVYRSTLVEGGHAFIEVTAVGDRTEIGKLAIAVAVVDNKTITPLNLQLEKLSKLIGVIGLAFASLTFSALLFRGFFIGEYSLTIAQWYCFGLSIASVLVALSPVWLPVVYDGFELAGKEQKVPEWLEAGGVAAWLKATAMGSIILMIGVGWGYFVDLLPSSLNNWLPSDFASALLQYFMIAVTLIVVAVPEGLAMSVTLSLAYSMRKMAADNNLVRQMHACETIGAATVICSDKTGTLTQNQMRVKKAHFLSLDASVLPLHHDAQKLIAEAIAVNSTADLEKKPDGEIRPIGNATEGALLLWLESQKLDYIPYRSDFEIEAQMPFSTQQKYMGTLGKSAVTQSKVFYLKGAPEIILARCTQILTTTGLKPLTNQAEIAAELQVYQRRGMRTLGFAYHDAPEQIDNLNKLATNLIWLGFVAIQDPIRTEVPEAIATCLKGGIEIKMVTGDNLETAREIATQMGLVTDADRHQQYTYLTGQQFSQLDDEQAKIAAVELKVLARARPLDKLRLVKLLQANDEVVAVTGDGTNDAAALKQAQVGLAMGSGTAIALEASDIVLLDDSFGSIINAVIWGRSLYENIQRFILFQLTINVAALGIVFLGPFIGVAIPLTIIQMLWVNLIMDTFAALALATESPNPEVITRTPRNPEAFIITPEMLRHIALAGLSFLFILTGFLLYLDRNGEATIYELTLFFTTFVMLQFWNMFNARCLGSNRSAFTGLIHNPSFIAIATIILVGQILIVQLGGSVFRTVPLSLIDWFAITLVTSFVLWIGELGRFLVRDRKSA
ncbi:calcium-translocating P-type ATPase, PMCA-type [Pleurocapsa sp. CCALA 161]|uniref:calcium-translocating P-type ATPase, PMCA-type n=1 Tax=Pleurocapsa sp. CCALA 161 TaxID=2107688 RepID=UPI000D06F198|nr:calcium-translocating P-type ATPase, PMCA-type [Pleurocapsa sp. CCALA 161]PSB11256.1 calcium-translocating P-type ATPase, PMCA-type [Pleurocapsa sp. CCALA 161]